MLIEPLRRARKQNYGDKLCTNTTSSGSAQSPTKSRIIALYCYGWLPRRMTQALIRALGLEGA